MSATIFKTGCSLAVIIAIIGLLQTTAAMDAMLLFAAAGVVPGTDIKLTPTATMWTLAAIALVSLLLIFSGNIVRLIRSLRRRKVELALAAPEALPGPIVPATTIKAEKSTSSPVVIIKVPGQRGHISRAFGVIGRSVVHALAFAAYQASVAGREVVSWSRYAVGVATLYAAYGWRWLKPRLIAFERKVNARLNQHQDITFVIEFLRSVTRVLSKWWADARTFAVAMWRKFMRKIA